MLTFHTANITTTVLHTTVNQQLYHYICITYHWWDMVPVLSLVYTDTIYLL